ncbi:MAG TPA: hypothetical protein VKT22_11085 [Steroidobacteraceae bacterium]|nr:hypothetical protein [Steroidobacteraceae bacterium]
MSFSDMPLFACFACSMHFFMKCCCEALIEPCEAVELESIVPVELESLELDSVERVLEVELVLEGELVLDGALALDEEVVLEGID